MKVLFVSQYFYPENFKGNDIVFDLVHKGHEVTVLTGKPNYPNGAFFDGYTFFNKSEEFINGARVIRTPLYPRKNGNGLNLVLNYFSFVFFSYFTCLFRLKGKFDIIFVQQLSPVTMALPGIWMKRRLRIPLVLWVLDLWPDSVIAASSFKNGIVIKILNKLVKYIYNQSDIILISSEYFRNTILNKVENIAKPIIYFPNWAEDIFTKPAQSDKCIPPLPIGFNIMFAGNLGEAQDFETILEAVKLTKSQNINWIIVGEGRKSEWIKREMKRCNLQNIFIFGRFPIESMPILFKEADAMLVSLKDEPVFALTVPAKIQAYMASGKIILGLLNGEGNTIINSSGSGYAVPAGDYLSLVQRVNKLKSLTENEKKTMQVNSRSFYAENYSKAKLLNKLEEILNDFVKIN